MDNWELRSKRVKGKPKLRWRDKVENILIKKSPEEKESDL